MRALLRRIFKRPAAKASPPVLQPECEWEISCTASSIELRDRDGSKKHMQKDALRGIAIETNDSGPWGSDVWWLLFGEDDRLEIAWPQGASGEQAVIDWIMALPGFDKDHFTDAMRSTGNAVFPVWRA